MEKEIDGRGEKDEEETRKSKVEGMVDVDKKWKEEDGDKDRGGKTKRKGSENRMWGFGRRMREGRKGTRRKERTEK